MKTEILREILRETAERQKLELPADEKTAKRSLQRHEQRDTKSDELKTTGK